MKPEEVFSRTLFGVILIGATFAAWGKWVTFMLGILFLISAASGVCLTCEIYKKLHNNKGNPS
jgi:hypothetical protein